MEAKNFVGGTIYPNSGQYRSIIGQILVNIGKKLVDIVLAILLQHLAASQMTGQDIDRTWERIQVLMKN